MSNPNTLPETVELPLLPLRDVVVFPHMVIPLFVGRPKSIKALENAMEAGKSILLVAQKRDTVGMQTAYPVKSAAAPTRTRGAQAPDAILGKKEPG